MAIKEEWDDVSDLTKSEMSSVTEWQEQFEERYDYVGRLVRSPADIIETPDEDENVKSSTSATTEAKSKSTTSESSDQSDLEVINPDQTELSEQK